MIQVIGGPSSITTGWGAISTEISLLPLGIPKIIVGIGLMLVDRNASLKKKLLLYQNI